MSRHGAVSREPSGAFAEGARLPSVSAGRRDLAPRAAAVRAAASSPRFPSCVAGLFSSFAPTLLESAEICFTSEEELMGNTRFLEGTLLGRRGPPSSGLGPAAGGACRARGFQVPSQAHTVAGSPQKIPMFAEWAAGLKGDLPNEVV